MRRAVFLLGGASGTSHPTRNALLAPHQKMGAGGKNKPPSQREVSRFTETEGAYKSIKFRVLPQSTLVDSSLPEGAFYLYISLSLYI